MPSRVNITVAGAGQVGSRHIEIIRQNPEVVRLVAVVEPVESIREEYSKLGIDCFPNLTEMFSQCKPDGVLLATPNQLHVENGLEVIEHKCPILVEKPIASTSEEAQILVAAAKDASVPILVGHHRRHNPLVAQVREIIESGRLGKIVSAHSFIWFKKPDEYYAPEWRRKPGAGPVLVNGIHEIDLLRYYCGEIARVFARGSTAVRNHEVDDTLVATLEFSSGALGTFNMSDSVTAPWCWELTSGENPAYATVSESSTYIGGTMGSISIPDNRVWTHGERQHWMSSVETSTAPVLHIDPLIMQLRHFASIIKGEDQPLVSGEEGIASLKVIEAILQSSLTNQQIELV